ncbi:MAG: hypothetical protein E7I45_13025 [Eikenella corrodens]|uniref:hypothetical protein n=1 Tax=Eikenella corrodens TaxID=539 RepID=UPI00291434E9|nr:hypothetical protein [Eikenella corrodens]MDU4301873.1 hypothetical protein [Eikenella corrodens]
MLTPEQETSLRLLSQRHVAPEDYEAAKELIDAGYADGTYRTSRQKGEYGRVLNLLWRGPTISGRRYLEELRQLKQRPNQAEYTHADNEAECMGDKRASEQPHGAQPVKKPWHERSTLNYLIVVVFGTVVGGLLVYILWEKIKFLF